jgi:uncharacterized short protein YbdD (DUF466 family)
MATSLRRQDPIPTQDTTQTKRSASVRILLRRFWGGVRDWCGDSAYERYLSAIKRRNTSSKCAPLSRDEFYVEQLNRRYSRPNRCC